MTFAEIALKNVRRKFRSYLIYFFSTAFSVVIFHLFCSLYYNPAFEAFRFGTGKMSVLFRGSAVGVFLFAAVFVLYSGSYFLKIQKKEIAVYSLLGMRKGRIALMMFFETFFIGLLAVLCGVILGTFGAKYAVGLLLRFMAESTDVTFSLSPEAMVITLFAFLGLFVLSGIRAYLTIYRYRLIDLLSADKQRQGIPSYSLGGAVAALVLLTIGYGITLGMDLDVGGLHLLRPTLISMVCILIGTYLLFRNGIPLAAAAVKKRKGFYYKTENFISVSQLAFRLKDHARLLTVIAMLTAATITLIGASYSFYQVVGGEGTEAYAPYSYLAKNIDEDQHDKIVKTIAERGEVSLVAEDKIPLIKVAVENPDYAVKDQQTGTAYPGKEAQGYLMSESMYLKIIAETDTPQGKLSETRSNFEGGLTDESCFFIDGNAVGDYCENLPGEKMTVTFDGVSQSYTVEGVSLHKYIGALDLYQSPTVVVSDDRYQAYRANAADSDIDIFYGFQFDDDMVSAATVDAINAFIPPRFDLGGLPGNISYIGVYKANFALFGSYAFIGFFLGALFSLASGSVMYYKLIMEAQEEAPRYEILRKTGMKKREAAASVAKLVGFVFSLPLAAGLLHTFFGLLLYNRALGEMSKQMTTLQSAFGIVLVFLAIYGIFCLLSMKSYFSIVWSGKGKTGK